MPSFIKINYIELQVKDFEIARAFYGGTLMSALPIHHIKHGKKKKLFIEIYGSVSEKCVFINADHIRGVTPGIEDLYRDQWLKEVRVPGISEEELEAALLRMEEDKTATLGDQFLWMKDAGVLNVNCWYKNNWFAVYSGTKTERY